MKLRVEHALVIAYPVTSRNASLALLSIMNPMDNVYLVLQNAWLAQVKKFVRAVLLAIIWQIFMDLKAATNWKVDNAKPVHKIVRHA